MSSSEDEYDPAGALDDIESTLDTLETILEPLLSGKMTWEEMLEKESGDHMGRAKLNMMMAFGVCDLLFVYLQMKGHDTTDHPVMIELKRVMECNAKIKEAETAPKPRMKLDTAAAGRFIQAAIPRSQRIAPGTTSSTPTPEPSKSDSKNKLTYEEVGMRDRKSVV